jgi:hypothetical protein
MPDFTALTATDYNGGGTPLNHPFVPVRLDGEKAFYANRNGGIPIGFERLSVNVREAKSATGAHVVEFELSIPVIALVDGKYVKVRESKSSHRFNFPQDGEPNERMDHLYIVKSLFGLADVEAVVEEIEGLY